MSFSAQFLFGLMENSPIRLTLRLKDSGTRLCVCVCTVATFDLATFIFRIDKHTQKSGAYRIPSLLVDVLLLLSFFPNRINFVRMMPGEGNCCRSLHQNNKTEMDAFLLQ